MWVFQSNFIAFIGLYHWNTSNGTMEFNDQLQNLENLQDRQVKHKMQILIFIVMQSRCISFDCLFHEYFCIFYLIWEDLQSFCRAQRTNTQTLDAGKEKKMQAKIKEKIWQNVFYDRNFHILRFKHSKNANKSDVVRLLLSLFYCFLSNYDMLFGKKESFEHVQNRWNKRWNFIPNFFSLLNYC